MQEPASLPPSSPTSYASPGHPKLRRSIHVALFVTSLLWFFLAEALSVRAARGLTNRFDIVDAEPLLSALFLIFLLVVGFSLLAAASQAGRWSLRGALGLPQRPGRWQEWALGAAIGWGVAAASVLPMALGRALHVRFWTDHRAFSLFFLHLATLFFATLALEIALRGYAFRQLIEATGPVWATSIMAVLLGSVYGVSPTATGISITVTVLGSVLLSVAWLRTHGLWLPWGLHFAWSAAVALVFGLPLRGVNSYASVVQTRALGRIWLTGREFGPDGALLTAIFLIVAIIILVRATSDYAWAYTRPVIVAAGYEVNPAPPAEHVAMEQEAGNRAPSLIQIQPTTPQSGSPRGYPPPPV